MDSEKEGFLNEMQKQMQEKNDDLQKLLLNKDLSKIEIHYGKLYSTNILETKESANAAIEDYKNSTSNALEGLRQSEFYQLN